VPRGGYATTSATPDAPALDVQSGVLCFEVTALQLQLGHAMKSTDMLDHFYVSNFKPQESWGTQFYPNPFLM
jgi:hypothetical protein